MKGSTKLQHRGNHVAALLAYRQPETLAEQLLAAQEQNNDLQEQLVRAVLCNTTVMVLSPPFGTAVNCSNSQVYSCLTHSGQHYCSRRNKCHISSTLVGPH